MLRDFQLDAYYYNLPDHLIAQHPVDKRDDSRLMVLDCADNTRQHRRFGDISALIDAKDMLVVNDTRVFPARLHGRKETGGKAEVFLLEFPSVTDAKRGYAEATALIKSSKRPKDGSKIIVNSLLSCIVTRDLGGGKARLAIHYDRLLGLAGVLEQCGQVPLPPYIRRVSGSSLEDVRRYQTVYANKPGAVAAPTAGLHFTNQLIDKITSRGTLVGQVTLHVGYGTFEPVRDTNITRHRIHREFLSLSSETVDKVAETKQRGGKIWAVGTTTVRALEHAARRTGIPEPLNDWCDLYIYPGYQFRVIDNLITNFHLPNSSLMFLVSALCGRKTLLDCYREAIKEQYRFFSYGDAMAILSAGKKLEF